MPKGTIEIVEFRGVFPSVDRGGQIACQLLAIDGVYQLKYGKPNYAFLPRAWVKPYCIRTFDVGEATSWQDFYNKCTDIVNKEQPFEHNYTPESTEFSPGVITQDLKTRQRLKAVIDATPERATRTLDEPSQVDDYLDELSEASSGIDDSGTRNEEYLLTDKAILLFTELLAEPLERPLSLEFEVSGYMALLFDERKKFPTIEIPVAAAIANGLSILLEPYKTNGATDTEDFRHLQAAVRYFTVSEDATSDYDSGGFSDDAAIFNMVARKLNQPHLAVTTTSLKKQQ